MEEKQIMQLDYKISDPKDKYPRCLLGSRWVFGSKAKGLGLGLKCLHMLHRLVRQEAATEVEMLL